MVFENVSESVREISEFTDLNRNEYKRVFTIKDGPFRFEAKKLYPCYLSGIFESLNAWVEWDILASHIRVEATKQQ